MSPPPPSPPAPPAPPDPPAGDKRPMRNGSAGRAAARAQPAPNALTNELFIPHFRISKDRRPRTERVQNALKSLRRALRFKGAASSAATDRAFRSGHTGVSDESNFCVGARRRVTYENYAPFERSRKVEKLK
ncbi:hypothetical protein EVAR_18699_1 [Eumeta japonica]|uniref:Uncharacterized protein n=1 Tax=Eumeta variegata TaxID=151549 RepID=A0A4C1U711_EUMVA|nr:hypothetical protein EVAR_18699_1 [Eumeta japonica]